MSETTFTGNNVSLRTHWEDSDRAKRFLRGGSRTNAVRIVIDRIKKYTKDNIWIDLATGAGFVQSQLELDCYPTLFVGIDLSVTMLRAQNPFGERIQASMFNIPVRRKSSDISSIFFSLSDYPDLNRGLKSICNSISSSGVISFVDYAKKLKKEIV